MEWISVKDRLPERNPNKRYSQVPCIVWDQHHGMQRVLVYNNEHSCWDDEHGDDYFTDAIGGTVTHWMPLPEPPKQS
jgi:hypothetical protein